MVQKRVVEDLLDLIARHIGDEAVLVAEKINAVGRELMERQRVGSSL